VSAVSWSIELSAEAAPNRTAFEFPGHLRTLQQSPYRASTSEYQGPDCKQPGDLFNSSVAIIITNYLGQQKNDILKDELFECVISLSPSELFHHKLYDREGVLYQSN
jgi:hypothetical protein